MKPEIIYFVTKVCSPNWSINNDLTTYYSLVFILEGSVDYEVDGHKFKASEGDVIVIPPGSHRSATTTGMSIVGIDFYLVDEQLDLPLTFNWGSFDEFHLLFQDLKFEWLQRNPGFQMKSEACLMLILHKLIYEGHRPEKNINVERMKQFIMKNFTEELTVSMVAEEIELSSVYCGALFKKVEGYTIAEFINRVRINEAATLLETGEYNISEVAYGVGFSDVYYFSNMFKKLVGVSPSKYKKSRFDAQTEAREKVLETWHQNI